MKKYEYKSVQLKTEGAMAGKVDTNMFDVTLNQMGSEGWELVGMTDLNRGNGYTRYVICVFMREVG